MSQIISDILKQFLGEPAEHNESSGQMSFDCPACAEDKGLANGCGDGKHKLALNYKKNIYQCWVCKFENNMHGSVPNLIKRYGNNKILKEYQIIRPTDLDANNQNKEIKVDLKLPIGYKKISESNYNDLNYGKAYRYLRERGITDTIIKEYNIGFTVTGKYHNRIIIPSYDESGELNYFISRAWDKWKKPKYLNPDVEKQLFIYNEFTLNWDGTIYLVEGVFDHIVVPNSIPLLGKTMYDRLKSLLLKNAKSDVVILLDDDAKDDAVRIYKELNVGSLYDRVKLCTPPADTDPSLIFEREGNRGIIKLLRSSEKILESNLY
tara:strand:+ start:471 stop:1433 length:963 start_codon:yes stop_codon:yes gene_type:complete